MVFFNEYFGMSLSVCKYRDNFVKVGQPYRLVEGRILWITEGCAEFELTLEQSHIKKGDIILLPPESIIELKSCSEDFNMMGIIYKESIPVNNDILIHAAEEDWHETLGLANMLWDIAHRTPFRQEMVSHLVSSIISDIQYINRAEQELNPVKRISRREEIFGKFKKLVNDNCCQHRNISYYADRLALTPHYLSTLVMKMSGRSVMYWVNRATLIQAKVLLKSNDMLICEVADRLNFPSQSAFGLFFKRETGMTPGEYQKAE